MDEANKEGTVKPKQKRDRSPAFPFISLKGAVARLVAFEATFGRHPTPAKLSGNAWGMKGWTSQAQQTLAALKAYGFIDYVGSGESLEASISEDGRTYLRAQQPIVKKEVLQRAALKPKNLAAFYSLWGLDRPPDAVCLDHLVLKSGFTETAAKAFLGVYDETLSYAGLSNSDMARREDVSESDDEMDDDLPEAEQGTTAKNRVEPAQKKVPLLREGMREVKFPLAEGDVTIFVPDGLSSDSVEDLSDYLEVFLKKARREAKLGSAENGGGNA